MDPELKKRIPILNDPQKILGVKATVLHENPPIVKLDGLLSPWECKYIIKKSAPKLEDSTIVVNNKEIVNKAGRSSRSAFITKSGVLPLDDPVIHRFLKRLSNMIDIPISHFEGMKVVNYQQGQQYLPHYDYFKDHDNFTKKIGDRMMTFFVYLNTLEEEEGGATSFPKLDLKVQPKAGSGTFWVNIDHNNNYFDTTFHGGEPVLGTKDKWGVNVWIRQNSYL